MRVIKLLRSDTCSHTILPPHHLMQHQVRQTLLLDALMSKAGFLRNPPVLVRVVFRIARHRTLSQAAHQRAKCCSPMFRHFCTPVSSPAGI